MIPPDMLGAAYPAAILLAGIFLSLVLEQLAHPRCPGLRRPLFSALLHAGLLLLAWSAALLIVCRPVFALLLVLAGQLLVIQVNNAKFRALREPFIFSDFGIFSQTIKHPRLYLPFLGLGRACLIAVAVAGAGGIGLLLEQPLGQAYQWSGMAVLAGAALVLGGLAATPAPSLDPEKDLARHGLFVTIAQYWVREKTRRPMRETRLPPLGKRRDELPDVIVIQSESFFDPRTAFPGIRGDVLKHFDEARASSSLHGRLTVPAWGANTMRPEFAFLTGIEPASLDIHRFNPYRRVARHPIRALPSVLREAGYSTTCIHPHPARFFRRDRAFPNMGFGRFIGVEEFQGAPKAGPYISDEAVTDKLLAELDAATQPAFFFVITMENHGPLHLESVSTGELDEFYREPPPKGCEELTVYLRHLRNADQQLGRLRRRLAKRDRPAILCFYGEHLPSMPRVYEILGSPDGRTNYFLEIFPGLPAAERDLGVEELPTILLQVLNRL